MHLSIISRQPMPATRLKTRRSIAALMMPLITNDKPQEWVRWGVVSTFRSRVLSMQRHFHFTLAPILCGVAVLAAPSAWAQTQRTDAYECNVHPRDAAAAAVLFHQGYKLRQEGQDDAACKKFEESARLDPMAGTLMNLAECRANQGKTATAAGWYHKAALLADNQGDKVLLEKAKQHATELDTELSYLTIQVEKPLPGLQIKRDDVAIGPAQFNEPLPIDPGTHEVIASAPGFKPLTLSVRVGEVADNKSIVVPALEPLPRTTVMPGLPSAPQRTLVTQVQSNNPWPWLLGGLGVTAIAVGSVSGILALHDKSRVEDACAPAKGCQNPQSYALPSQRDSEWTVARITFPVGVAAVGAAATWLLFERRSRHQDSDSAGQTINVSASQRGGQLWVSGRF